MKKTLQFLFLSLISVTAFAQSSNGFGPAEGQSIALGSQVTVDIFMRFDKAWAERDYETLKSYVDEKATMITKDALLKTLCWYDNGWGFSKRILEVVDAYAKLEETS